MSLSTILRTRFIVKKDKAKNNLAPVYARLTLAGKSVDISLKRDIDLDKWDTVTGRAKGNRDEGRTFNSFFDQVRAELTDCATRLKFEGKPVTADAIKNLYYGVVPEGHTLLELIDYHNNHLKHTLEWGTLKIIKLPRNILKPF